MLEIEYRLKMQIDKKWQDLVQFWGAIAVLKALDLCRQWRK